MKHISKRTAMCAAVLGLSAVLSSCGSTPAADPDQTDIITVGVSEGGMEVDTPETSARIVLPPTEPVVIEEDDSAPLLDRVNNCIYLYEYGKAVKLMEDNPEESSDPSFDDAKNELLVHFTDRQRTIILPLPPTSPSRRSWVMISPQASRATAQKTALLTRMYSPSLSPMRTRWSSTARTLNAARTTALR